MEKSLCDRLTKRELTKGTRNKVAFLALRHDIHEAIKAGWAIKTIWEILCEEGKISFSYKTFRVCVSRLILDESSNQKQRAGTSRSTIKCKPSTAIPTFTFQPKPKPEELL